MKNLFVVFVLAGVSALYASTAPKVDLSGRVEYGLAYDYVVERDTNGDIVSAAPDFQNRYLWDFKLKINIFENLFAGFRFSNPSGYESDIVKDNISSVVAATDSGAMGNALKSLIAMPECYFRWNYSKYYLSAGIIPVEGNTVLDLAAFELNGYAKAGSYDGWSVTRNNSLTGLATGFEFYRDGSNSFGMDIIAAMGTDAPGTNRYNAFLRDQQIFILSLPASVLDSKLQFNPVMHLLLNRFRSENNEESNAAVEGGLDMKFAPIELLSLKLGIAGGMYSNDALSNDSGYVSYNPLGVLLESGLKLKVSSGDILLDFNYARYRNRAASPVVNNDSFFWSLSYIASLKNLTIEPRFRFWHRLNDLTTNDNLQLRPELLLRVDF